MRRGRSGDTHLPLDGDEREREDDDPCKHDGKEAEHDPEPIPKDG